MSEENKLTFEKDNILNRKVYAETIINIIKEGSSLSNDDGLVIALDSPWGTGKTTFIEKLKSKIEDEQEDIIVVKYNAWENDYIENAFTPLVYELFKNNDFKDKFRKEIDINSDLKSAAFDIGIAFAKDMFSKFKNTIDVLSKKAKDLIDKDIDELSIFDDIKGQKKAIKEFIQTLSNSEFLNNNNKLLIIVDELDRCKPLFAIQTLEIIKHIFNIKNVVFLLSVDFDQLRHSIATVYGQNMDSDGYLRRFVHSIIKLLNPTTEDYINFLLIKTNFIALITNGINNEYFKDFKNDITHLFDILKLTPRDMNIIFQNFLLYFISRFKQLENIKLVLPYLILMTIKYKYPNIYNKIIDGNYQLIKNENKISILESLLGKRFHYLIAFSEPMYKYLHKNKIKIIKNDDLNIYLEGLGQLKNIYSEVLYYPQIPGQGMETGFLYDDFVRLYKMADKEGYPPDIKPIEYLAMQIEMFDLDSR